MKHPVKAPLVRLAQRFRLNMAAGAFGLLAIAACTASGAAPTTVSGSVPDAGTPAGETSGAADTGRAGFIASERVEGLLKQMTTAEKLGQLNQMAGGRQIALNSRITDAEYDRVRAGGVGSYLHVAGAEFLGELQRVAVEESRLGIPLLFAMDVVHGYRTMFPVPLGIAATFDTGAAELSARIAAIEATGAGLHWTFAPMIDIARDARWGRVVEGAGEEPFFVAAMARAQVRGYQDGDLSRSDTILATAKHFGAYGAGTGGRDYDSADISERTLKEVYLPPFRAAAEEGAGSFMVAFNDIGGVPTTANRALVNDLLRDVWNYQGLVVSDWNSVLELINHGVAATRAEAGALALQASVDMEMTSGIYAADMIEAVEASPGLQAELDASVRRVLTAKERLGLFDDPYIYHDPAREAALMLAPQHRDAARQVAERSLVLLRNDAGLLPLAEAPGRVALIGMLADDARSMIGSWKAQGLAEDVTTLAATLKDRLGDNLVYEPGAATRGAADPDMIARAVRAAESADLVILVTGEDYDLSGEARSRSDIALPQPQQVLARAILATGKPVVTVLMTGRPLDLGPLDEHEGAILLAWFPGTETGPAIVNTLFGDVSPAGRLPVTFPRRTGQAPVFMGHYPTGRPANPDLSVDSARYMDIPITPAYAFGHGLSYADFEYGGLTVSAGRLAPGETVTISAAVTNVSAMDADEVVQLHIRDPVAQVARPVQEMRGFRRVMVPAGETRRVDFTLRPEQFAYLAPSGKFEADAGRIDFQIGPSSDDIRLTGSIELTAPLVSPAAGPSFETLSVIQAAAEGE